MTRRLSPSARRSPASESRSELEVESLQKSRPVEGDHTSSPSPWLRCMRPTESLLSKGRMAAGDRGFSPVSFRDEEWSAREAVPVGQAEVELVEQKG